MVMQADEQAQTYLEARGGMQPWSCLINVGIIEIDCKVINS